MSDFNLIGVKIKSRIGSTQVAWSPINGMICTLTMLWNQQISGLLQWQICSLRSWDWYCLSEWVNYLTAISKSLWFYYPDGLCFITWYKQLLKWIHRVGSTQVSRSGVTTQPALSAFGCFDPGGLGIVPGTCDNGRITSRCEIVSRFKIDQMFARRRSMRIMAGDARTSCFMWAMVKSLIIEIVSQHAFVMAFVT